MREDRTARWRKHPAQAGPHENEVSGSVLGDGLITDGVMHCILVNPAGPQTALAFPRMPLRARLQSPPQAWFARSSTLMRVLGGVVCVPLPMAACTVLDSQQGSEMIVALYRHLGAIAVASASDPSSLQVPVPLLDSE